MRIEPASQHAEARDPWGGHGAAQPVMLAPMEGHSDAAFRRVCRSVGADVAFTEFTPWQTLRRGRGGGQRKIAVQSDEGPVGIQLYGRDPERMADATRSACAQAPTLIDLNFGCPAKGADGGGCGSQLMREPALLHEVVAAVLVASDRPVSCKLRLGWDADSINVVEVAQRLEEQGVAALTVHGRTRCQKYEGRADWDWIARVVEAVSIPVVGNGDVASAEDAARLLAHTGARAVMIGRAAMEDPWIFARVRAQLRGDPQPAPPDAAERIALARRHLDWSVAERGADMALRRMRSRYRLYLGALPGFAALRSDLVRLEAPEAVHERLERFRETLANRLGDRAPPGFDAAPAPCYQ